MGRAQDEKSEFEFQHPPEARGSWTNEVAEERNRTIYCQFKCKEAWRKQMAHRLIVVEGGRRGICNWCYKGEPHPEERDKEKGKRKKEKVEGGPGAAVQTSAMLAAAQESQRLGARVEACENILKRKDAKEETMAEKCKCGRPWNHKGRCWVRRGLKAAPEAKKAGGRRRAAAGRGDQHKVHVPGASGGSNGGSVEKVEPVTVPVAALDKWFDSLPDKQKAFIFAREVGA